MFFSWLGTLEPRITGLFDGGVLAAGSDSGFGIVAGDGCGAEDAEGGCEVAISVGAATVCWSGMVLRR